MTTIATVQFDSRVLQTSAHYTIILPDQGPGPYPVLLLLHGHGDTYTTWLQSTKLALYAKNHSMIIVMPDGGTSMYLNLDEPYSFRKWHSQRYEDFIIQDLPVHIRNTYRVRAGRWAIGGNSMGGYGAMRLGCKYPDLFASIWAHSGRYCAADELEEVVPDHEDADSYTMAERLLTSPHKVDITFDCGDQDVLIERNRKLHAHMQSINLPHRYIEQAGDHSWNYWDEQLPAALKHHAAVLEQEM